MASKARWQVAWLPEALRGRAMLLSRTALGTLASLLLATPGRAQPAANARPSGGVVTAGSATIGTSASTTTITQASQRAAVNWQGFNVGAQQTVDFIQPSSSAVALNRVLSPNPSQIAGRIDANGQIILINQSGVIFYQGAQVNTAGLIVSAAGMSDLNFMAGRLVFDQAAQPNAAVVNQGTLTVQQAGLAALVAPQVANSGVITAKLGHVVLAGAKTATLDLYGDGMLSLDVNNEVTQAPLGPDGAPVTALVTNTGVVRAAGGTVQLTARETDGLVQDLVQAGGKISADSVGSKTGTVVLGGLGGSIVLSGVVAANGSAPGSTGGQVQVDASQGVTLAAGARVSASGPAGGGTVAIGTTLARAQGGPGTASTLTAQTVQVVPGASIAANATGNGNGGRVSVLSSQSTSMAGNIAAMGGPQGGNGGFVEVSGPVLALTGLVNTTAPLGVTGTLLLDPTDLWISDVAPPDATGFSWMSPATLQAEESNIVLSASGNVFLATTNPATDPGTNTLNLTGAIYYDSFSLTLTAGANLTVDRGFTVITSGNISLTATGGAITLDGSSGVTGGLITASQLRALGPTSLQVPDGGNITMNAHTGIALADATLGTVDAPIGTLDLSTASGGVSQTAAGAIMAFELTSSAGLGGNVALLGTNNAISTVTGLVDSSGAVTLVDNPPESDDDPGELVLSGTISGSNLFIDVAQPGGALTLGVTGFEASGVPATLIAAAGGRISLVADSITEVMGTTITAAAGTVELAPYSAINTSLLGTNGLVLHAPLLASIDASTLVVGGFTNVPAGATTPTPSAASVSIDDTFTPTESTLVLLANGPITQTAGALTVGTLSATGTTINVTDAGNAIGNLGNVTATSFALDDATSLTVLGIVNGGASAVISDSGGALSISGTVRASAISLSGSAITITGETTDGGAGVTSLLATAGGISETGGKVIAGTLAGSSVDSVSLGISSTNTIATLAGFSASAPASSFVLTDTASLSVTGAVSAPNGSYIESAGATGIKLGAAASVTTGGGVDVSFQADAFSIATGGAVVGLGAQFELAPNTPGLGVTLGASGSGLSLASLAGIGPTSVRIGAVTLPGNSTPTTTAGSIVIGGNFGASGVGLELDATGQVTEGDGPALTAGTLTGTAAGFQLTSTFNAIGTIDDLVATAGNIAVVDGENLVLTGTESGGNLFFEVATDGGTLSLGTVIDAATLPATLTATAGGRISLVADNLSETAGNSVTATGGSVELAPFSPVSASLLGSSGWNVGASLLSVITTGTLVVGGYTNVPGAATTPAASATSVSLDGAVNLTGVASTLLLQARGAISEPVGPLTVGTLAANGGVITLNNPANAITALGNITGTSVTLDDSIALALNGGVNATSSVSITDAVSLTLTGGLAAPSVTLSAGSGGIALTGTAALGQSGATVDLTSSGGVNEVAGATLTAGTLQSTGGVTGGAASFVGNNSIAVLGDFTVTGNALSLSDTGALSVAGPVTASAVTIGGALVGIGSTPTSITLTGALTAPTITLSAGGGGIALNGTSAVGESGATVDLSSTGGVSEAAGATLTAATLESIGGVSGGAATFAGTANAIATLGGFTVAGGALSLSDTGALTITGPVTTSAVLIGGAARSTPTAITLTGELAAATVALSAGSGGIALNTGSALGQSGAIVDLTSAGGVSEASGATLTAGVLESTGGVSGGAASFAGTANAVGTLGSFAVTNGALTLSDTAALNVGGTVTASVLTIGGTAGSTPTSLNVGGSLRATSTVNLTAGAISIRGLVSDGGSGTTVLTATTGGISETGTLIAGTLSGSAPGAVALAGATTASNQVATLAGFTAPSFALTDGTNLLVSSVLAATDIALTAPASQISLANGASIVTGGTIPATPGPLVAGLEPSNGAPGAYIQAASFSQIGSSSLSGPGGAPATLQISVSQSANFDPSLGLRAGNGWLILNLGNGTASGNVYVGALNVTYAAPGSASLSGTIDGITGDTAALSGFIQPSVNPSYLFNGCEIGATTCAVSVLPPFFPTLSSLPPPLISLEQLEVLALPLEPAPTGQLTDPDVVPPNISYVDY